MIDTIKIVLLFDTIKTTRKEAEIVKIRSSLR